MDNPTTDTAEVTEQARRDGLRATEAIEAPQATADTQEATTPATEAVEAVKEGVDTVTLDEHKAKVKKLSDENAGWRVKFRQAEQELAKAKADMEAAQANEAEAAKYAELNATLTRENLALKHGVPEELRDLITASTPEEIEAQCKLIAQHTQEKAPSTTAVSRPLSGGLDPASSGEESTEAFIDRMNAFAPQRRI